jgi:esterase/lipase superfamily enzyme/nucleoid DNA-binding protein
MESKPDYKALKNKTAIVQLAAMAAGVSKAAAQRAFDATIQCFVEVLRARETLKISGLGHFAVRAVRAEDLSEEQDADREQRRIVFKPSSNLSRQALRSYGETKWDPREPHRLRSSKKEWPELLMRVVDSAGITKEQAQIVIDIMVRAIIRAFIDDEELSIPAFGTFHLRQRTFPRSGRNPRTGEQISIPPRIPGFKPKESLLESLIAESSILVRVFYGTDRLETGKKDASDYYGSDRGSGLRFGMCAVTVPKDHRIGQLESPSIWKLEFREDPAKHVVLKEVTPLPPEDFYAQLKSGIGESGRKEALVFVHGFNVTFEDAVRRTAQIAYDLKFDGAPVCYSWPSKGTLSLAGYRYDATNIQWTAAHLEQFLADIAARSGAQAIHLIAHSMGNQALTAALDNIARGMRAGAPPAFTEVMLTAPDIDADVFVQLAAEFKAAAERVTLYASSNDKALKISKQYHGDYARAGDTSGKVVIVPGVDTIDVSAVDTNLVGHFYYGDNDSVLADMFYVIKDKKPPKDRFRLVPKQSPAGQYWVFQ